MKKIMAVVVILGIWFIPVSGHGEGVYKGKIWREQGVVSEGVPVPVEESYPSAKTNGEKIVSTPCHKRSAPAKPALKPKKIKTMCADSCLKEIRRNSEVIRKLERELGAAKERARNLEAWIEDYRKEYIKHDGWKGLHK
jgi:hypothetical protein